MDFKQWLEQNEDGTHTVRTNRNVMVQFDPEVPRVFMRIVNKKFAPEYLADLCGALPNMKVYASATYGTIMLQAFGKGIKAARTIMSGRIVNDDIYIEKQYRGQGTLAKMLNIQADSAHKLGIEIISAFAQKGGDNNGYYTLPRLGFDAETKQGKLSNIMGTPEGRESWKQGGSAMKMLFSTNPDGYSRQTLNQYLAR